MTAISRILILCFVIGSSLAEVALAGPEDARPSDGRELEIARDLLHQAQRVLDSQYKASPTGGYRYTDGVAAALASCGSSSGKVAPQGVGG